MFANRSKWHLGFCRMQSMTSDGSRAGNMSRDNWRASTGLEFVDPANSAAASGDVVGSADPVSLASMLRNTVTIVVRQAWIADARHAQAQPATGQGSDTPSVQGRQGTGIG